MDSVLGQTLRNLEIIIVNDGSPDNSESICLEYIAKDPRITYIKQENQGVSAARNKGLNLARGEYVYFLDSDDFLDSLFLEQAYNTALTDNSDLVVVSHQELTYLHMLGTLNIFVRRSFLEQNPLLRFPEGVQPCEDGILGHMLMVLLDKISLCTGVVYFYRQHAIQNSRNIVKNRENILKQIPSWFEILDEFYDFYDLRTKKSYQLAIFLQYEVFKYVFYLPLNNKQRQWLHRIIRNYYQKSIRPYLTAQEYKKLTLHFRVYINFKTVFYFTWMNRIIIIKNFIIKPFKKTAERIKKTYEHIKKNLF